MAELSIPSREFTVLAKIVDLDELVFAELVKVLRETPPPLGREKFVSKLTAKFTKMDRDEFSQLLNSILALFRVREKLKFSALKTASLVKDAATEPSKQHCSHFENGRDDILEKRLAELLSIDSTLGLGTKCVLAMEDNERVCLSAEILSDMRPIFSDDTKAIIGGVVNHSLSLHFKQGTERDHSDFYLTLDDNDLERLKVEIEKAQEKSIQIKTLLNKSNIFCLGSE